MDNFKMVCDHCGDNERSFLRVGMGGVKYYYCSECSIEADEAQAEYDEIMDMQEDW